MRPRSHGSAWPGRSPFHKKRRIRKHKYSLDSLQDKHSPPNQHHCAHEWPRWCLSRCCEPANQGSEEHLPYSATSLLPSPGKYSNIGDRRDCPVMVCTMDFPSCLPTAVPTSRVVSRTTSPARRIVPSRIAESRTDEAFRDNRATASPSVGITCGRRGSPWRIDRTLEPILGDGAC